MGQKMAKNRQTNSTKSFKSNKVFFWCSRVEPHEVNGRDLPPRCYIAPPMYVRKKSSKF